MLTHVEELLETYSREATAYLGSDLVRGALQENLKAVLAAADMTFDNVVKTTIFIMNMGDFTRINSVYGAYFDEATAPARETVQVACLPRNVNIEISMIAMK